MTSFPGVAVADDYHASDQRPPPLPPRPSNTAFVPGPEESLAAMSSHDPRSSSTQSLVPDPAVDSAGRRRLLLIYIHGFMGNETSFRSFPAHVHNLVTITLSDSHTVHTKIYPKYRSRYSLEVARDDFSAWLTPHEDNWTDVILLGHSMGGLVAADIALLLRHRIIGIINFDVPFVGMHPGIVKAGLGSIFKPWPTPEEPTIEEASQGKRPSRMNTLFNPKPADPNYNPSFENDVHLPVRKGWENTLHWVNKHSNGLIAAGKSLVKSHFEFGSAMADYSTLKVRYARIRALEEDNEEVRRSANPESRHPPRIRFVNYYTTSTGRPKKPKSPKSPSPSRPSSPRPASRGLEHEDSNLSVQTPGSLQSQTMHTNQSAAQSRISVEVQEHRGNEVVPVSPQEPLSATSSTTPATQHSYQSFHDGPDPTPPTLPEIPPIPEEPPFVDLAEFTDKTQRKSAEKEHDQALKEYHKAVKARNKVINERSRIEEKWEKDKRKAQKQREKEGRGGETTIDRPINDPEVEPVGEDLEAIQLGDGNETPPPPYQDNSVQSHGGPYGNYDFSRSTIMNQDRPPDNDNSSITDSMNTLTTVDTNASTNPNPDSDTSPKKKRLKKFCMLPPKDANGNKDPTWVRVFMEGVDEVTAHTTLFFMSDTYEKLVGDVGARIEDWVREADSLRLVREMEGM